MAITVSVTLLALAGLLVAERIGSRSGVWIAKPLASTGFVATGLVAAGADRLVTGDSYSIFVLSGLVLSWWGDVLLIPKQRPSLFRAGILAFLLGHIAYAGAFASAGLGYATAGAAALGLGGVAAWVLRRLRPNVPPDLVVPVYAYVAVISAMVVCAASTQAPARATILAGALLFYVSDLAVARDRFIAPGFSNAAWGLPLYYCAQLVLASTLSAQQSGP